MMINNSSNSSSSGGIFSSKACFVCGRTDSRYTWTSQDYPGKIFCTKKCLNRFDNKPSIKQNTYSPKKTQSTENTLNPFKWVSPPFKLPFYRNIVWINYFHQTTGLIDHHNFLKSKGINFKTFSKEKNSKKTSYIRYMSQTVHYCRDVLKQYLISENSFDFKKELQSIHNAQIENELKFLCFYFIIILMIIDGEYSKAINEYDRINEEYNLNCNYSSYEDEETFHQDLHDKFFRLTDRDSFECSIHTLINFFRFYTKSPLSHKQSEGYLREFLNGNFTIGKPIYRSIVVKRFYDEYISIFTEKVNNNLNAFYDNIPKYQGGKRISTKKFLLDCLIDFPVCIDIPYGNSEEGIEEQLYLADSTPIDTYSPISEHHYRTQKSFENNLNKHYKGKDVIIKADKIFNKLNNLPKQIIIITGGGYDRVKASFTEIVKQYAIDSEKELRELKGLHQKGEKWVNETLLYNSIKTKYPEYTVHHDYGTKWLKPQRLDVYIEEINVGVEYQGKQHQEPVEFFGGIEGFKKIQERDAKKKRLCEENNCTLIYVYPDESDEVVDKKIEETVGSLKV